MQKAELELYENIAYEKILNVFGDYLDRQTSTEFVRSSKFGYLYISSWSVCDDSAYDVIHIRSAEHLCEVIVDVLVYDYLAEKEEVCLNEADIKSLYRERLEPYIVQLSEYQQIFQDKFTRVLALVYCRNI